MKISLVQCPGWTVDTPPLGIAYLSAYLKDHGHDVVLHDFNIDAYASLPETYHYLWDPARSHWLEDKFDQKRFFRDHVERWGREIVDTQSRVVGFSIYESTYKLSCKVARFVRAADPGRVIVFGGEGCVPGSREMDYLLRNVDHCCFVVGEGEQSLLEFVEAVERGDDIEKIPGLGMNVKGTLKTGPKRKPIRDLDTLPYPDFDSLPLEKYRRDSDIPILGSRGCVARCAFCSDHIFWQRCRWRSAENIVEEMLRRFEKGYRSFRFCDLLINANMAEFENLCDRILESDMAGKIQINGQFRCHRGMKGELLAKAKKAGLDFIGYGVESGSQTILDGMRKNYSLKTIENNLEATHRAGILTSINIIVGFPGETDQTLDETIEFIKRNSPYIDMIQDLNTFKIRPSSPVARDLDSYDIVHKSKDPDMWESKDGGNTMLWRLEGCRKVYRTAEEEGIRLGFSEYHFYYHPLMQQTLLETAQRHMALGNYAEAMGVFQKNLSINPEAFHLLPELEKCYSDLPESDKRTVVLFLKKFFSDLPPKLLDIHASPKGLSISMIRELMKEKFFVGEEVEGKTYLFSGKYLLKLRDYDQAILHLKKAGELLSDPALSFHDYGVCCLELGELDRAYDYLKSAVEKGEQNDWTLPVLGLVSEMKGEPAEAEKYYQEHRRSEELGRESRIYVLFRLMKVRLEAGDRDEAFELLGEVKREKPDEISMGGRLRIVDALADLRVEVVGLAAECYRFLAEWFPDNDEFWEGLFESLLQADNPEELVEFVRMALEHQSGEKVARRLFERGVGEDVVRMIEEYGERMGESGRWMLQTAGRYWRLAGRSRRAMSCYQRALEKTEWDEPAILRDIGECRLELGDLDEAKSFLKKAFDLYSALERVHYDLALVSEGQGDPEGARAHYLANLEVEGQEARSYLLALVRLAAMSLAEGETERSQSYLERAEEFEDKDDLEAKGALAYSWARLMGSRGMREEAANFYREAVKVQPKLREYVEALIEELTSCGREEELTREIADLAGMVDADVLAALLGRVEGGGEMLSRFEKEAATLEGGGGSGLLRLLARYWKEQGDANRALDLYRKARLSGGEETGEVLKDMGECHLELGEPGEARKLLERALEVNPDLEWAKYHMGVVCEREGDPEGAREYYHENLKGKNRSPWSSLMTFVRLADLSLAEGDIDGAQTLLEKAEEYDERESDNAKGALAFRWAQIERGRGRGEEAVDRLRAAVKAQPQCEEYIVALVEELGRAGRVEELVQETISMVGDVNVEVLAKAFGEVEGSEEYAGMLEKQAAALEEDAAPGHLYLIARYWKEQGDADRALDLYRKATASRGEETGEILRDMGECHLELGEPGEARKLLERALEVNPDLEWAHYHMGVVCEGEGDPEGAREHYHENLKGKNRSPWSSLMTFVRLADMSLAEGDVDGAQTLLEKAEAYDERENENAKGALAFRWAQVERGRGRVEEAVVLLRAAVKAQPRCPEYIEALVEELGRAGRMEELVQETISMVGDVNVEVLAKVLGEVEGSEECAGVLEKQAAAPELLYLLARYWKEEDPRRALDLYGKVAVSGGEETGEILRDMGECHLELGEPGEARELLERALEVNPDLEGTHYYMGVVCEGEEDPEGAREHYLENLKGKNRSPWSSLMTFVRLADLRLAEGDIDGAQALLEKAEEYDGRESENAKGALAFGWAQVERGRGRGEEAVDRLRAAVKAQPRCEDYIVALVEELGRAGRVEELVQEIISMVGDVNVEVLAKVLGEVEGSEECAGMLEKQAAALEEDAASGLLYLIARYWKGQGAPRRALDLYGKVAASGGEETGEILRDMGECHLELGEPGEARKLLERALEVNSDLEGAHYYMGVVCEGEEDPEGAREHYLENLKGKTRSSGSSFMTYIGLADLRLAEGDVDGAQTLLEKAEEYDEGESENAKGALAFRWARVERGRGRGEEALNRLRESLEAQPQCEEFAMALIEELGRCGLVDELSREVVAMIGRVRIEVLARVLGRLENGGECVAGIEEEAAGLENEDALKLLYLVARYWKDQGDPRRALDLYLKVTACGGEETGEILRDMGECHLELCELDEARQFLERALDLNSKLEWADYDLGIVSERQGNLEGARARYLMNLEVSGRNPSCLLITLVRLSTLCLEEGNLSEAEEWLKKGEPYLQYADSVTKAAWAFGKAKVARGLGMRDEVLSCLKEAVRLDPQRDEYRMELSLELEGRRSDL